MIVNIFCIQCTIYISKNQKLFIVTSFYLEIEPSYPQDHFIQNYPIQIKSYAYIYIILYICTKYVQRNNYNIKKLNDLNLAKIFN